MQSRFNHWKICSKKNIIIIHTEGKSGSGSYSTTVTVHYVGSSKSLISLTKDCENTGFLTCKLNGVVSEINSYLNLNNVQIIENVDIWLLFVSEYEFYEWGHLMDENDHSYEALICGVDKEINQVYVLGPIQYFRNVGFK